jgi:HEXXH motif-containing protein
VIAYHEVPPDHFTALASGLGGPAAVGLLARIQHSKHLLLLRGLTEAWSGEAAACATAVDVLIRADRQNHHEVAQLIADPMVGAWAVQATRRLGGAVGASTTTVSADFAQLGALAAAAAFRTGIDAVVPTRTLSGTVTLPTLGDAVLGSDGPAIVTVDTGRATVTRGTIRVALDGRDPRWRELRQLVARDNGLEGAVAVEDGSPYRDCYHAPPADRLPHDEFQRWQGQFDEAWRLLARYVPERAAELSVGLRSLVPLAAGDDGVARSGTARDAFGTLGLTPPRSATELAITLVHEFQHSKLSVLLDVVPLYRPGGAERHFAPWRTDPRPTGGLIQGVYAFLGVADTWRGLRSAPNADESATRGFAFARAQVAAGLAALEDSTELTPQGRKFTEELGRAVDELKAERLPEWAVTAARSSLEERRNEWHRQYGIRHHPNR